MRHALSPRMSRALLVLVLVWLQGAAAPRLLQPTDSLTDSHEEYILHEEAVGALHRELCGGQSTVYTGNGVFPHHRRERTRPFRNGTKTRGDIYNKP